MPSFRDRLIATLRAIQPVLDAPGVLVIGSEVPNLLEEKAASTLVVSQGVDVGVPVCVHALVKELLARVRGLRPSQDEPSVWVPDDATSMLEVNFVGMDPGISEGSQTYVLEDPTLPLMVFAPLSYMRPGKPIEVAGMLVPVPRVAGLLLEKLVTDRSGEKGDRDLLVVVGLLASARDEDLAEVVSQYAQLSATMRYAVRSSLSVLSLMSSRPGMPDPGPCRERVAMLLRALESGDQDCA